MKKLYTLFILFVVTNMPLLAQPFALELYYDHIPNSNKYIFTVMEQVGAPTSTSQITVASNSPAGSFSVNRVFILPYNNNCSNSTHLQVYRSDTIVLPSIPSTGYRFGITDCCRLPNLVNISNPGSTGFYVETSMYPVPGETYANSAPRFVNPAIWQRLSTLQNWHQPALDPDNDSIYYTITPLYQGTFSSPQQATYNTGYSGTMPFGTSASLLIDQELGIMQVSNANQGTFAVNLQVRSYAGNTLTAVVNRDIMLTNVIPAGFQPAINLNNFYSTGSPVDTSMAIPRVYLEDGDTVSVDVTGTSLVAQDSVYMGATSTLLPLSLHTVGNCSAYCAQFNPNPNLHGTGTATAQFVYVAESTHFSSADTAYQRVIFLAASQLGCQPFQYINAFFDIYLVQPSNVGLNELIKNGFSVFPNPAQDILRIEVLNPKPSSIELFNLQGELVLKTQSESNKIALNVADLPSGLYLVKVGESTQKVIIH
jgi:hypothetical protein